MFTQLRIKNFKAWRDEHRFDLAPVTLLLGVNSAGKTSLLQPLLLLKQTAESPDRRQHLNLGDRQATYCISHIRRSHQRTRPEPGTSIRAHPSRCDRDRCQGPSLESSSDLEYTCPTRSRRAGFPSFAASGLCG